MLLKRLFSHMKHILNSVFVNIVIKLILAYKIFLSPFLGNNCRYTPTCSEYAMESFKDFGFLKGFKLSLYRILRCNPWGGSGYDPPPVEVSRFKKEKE